MKVNVCIDIEFYAFHGFQSIRNLGVCFWKDKHRFSFHLGFRKIYVCRNCLIYEYMKYIFSFYFWACIPSVVTNNHFGNWFTGYDDPMSNELSNIWTEIGLEHDTRYMKDVPWPETRVFRYWVDNNDRSI